ncbi:hypothetical protein ACIGXM_28205 [Kitasatospora sp. NPDC052896]|uniref:hypothetical protein n=1 Tax=Kitasatospora sp. NPDC052896 TaxID=3364061 RepID=UPI0037C64914
MVAISRNAEEVRRLAAEPAGVAPEQLLIGSTEVIGRRYPMDQIRAGLAALDRPLGEADFAATCPARRC